MLARFQTSKLPKTSTTTHRVAPRASKRMRCERAVMASEPRALHSVKAATRAWHRHHEMRVCCSLDRLLRHSLNVGTGNEAGSARGALGGGSRKTWCETLLCLYLCPRRWPTVYMGSPVSDLPRTREGGGMIGRGDAYRLGQRRIGQRRSLELEGVGIAERTLVRAGAVESAAGVEGRRTGGTQRGRSRTGTG